MGAKQSLAPASAGFASGHESARVWMPPWVLLRPTARPIKYPHTEIRSENASDQWRISADASQLTGLFEKQLIMVWNCATLPPERNQWGAAVMIRKPRRAALYLRVGRDGQTTENQRLVLEAVASQRGWTVTNAYEDNGISGAKGRDKRPGLDALLKDASRARFDMMMAWALDRLGRSLRNLMDTLQDLESANVDLFLHQQVIDTTTPAGRVFFHILGAFSEFERDMIRSRVNAGLDRARAPRAFGLADLRLVRKSRAPSANA